MITDKTALKYAKALKDWIEHKQFLCKDGYVQCPLLDNKKSCNDSCYVYKEYPRLMRRILNRLGITTKYIFSDINAIIQDLEGK